MIEMTCKKCGSPKVENKDTMLCASCNKSSRDTKSLYPTVREMFLKRMMAIDEKCPVTKIPIDMSDDIHHKMGRVGYADQWAYDNDIPLIIDVRYFLAVQACCAPAHRA